MTTDIVTDLHEAINGAHRSVSQDHALMRRAARELARLEAALFVRAEIASDMLSALKQIEAEMRAGFGSSLGETREQIRRAIAKAEASLPTPSEQ